MEWTENVADSTEAMKILVKQQSSLGFQLLKQFPAQHILRTFQLDALHLDYEITNILKKSIDSALNIAPLEFLKFRHAEELHLLLQLVIYKYGIWDSGQSPAQRMQNLIYRDEKAAGASGAPLSLAWSSQMAPKKSQKLLHLLLTIIVPYIYTKINQRSNEENWGNSPQTLKRRIAWVLRWMGNLVRAVSFLHVLVFLMDGRYSSIVDRVTRMRLVAGDRKMRRLVNTNLMTQDISWNAWSSFLAVALPLLRLGSVWGQTVALSRSVVAGVASGAQGAAREGRCASCHEPIVVLRVAEPCEHAYCYHCIASRDPNFFCNVCGDRVTGYH